MASSFSRLRGDIEGDLEDQVARLTKELSSLKKSLSKRGASAYEDTRDTASDLYGELRDRFSETLAYMRKRAHAAEHLARDNPTTTAAVVGLVVVGLLVTMLARSIASGSTVVRGVEFVRRQAGVVNRFVKRLRQDQPPRFEQRRGRSA